MQLALSIRTCVFPFRLQITLKVFLKKDGECQPTIVCYGREEKTLGIYLKPSPSSSHLRPKVLSERFSKVIDSSLTAVAALLLLSGLCRNN